MIRLLTALWLLCFISLSVPAQARPPKPTPPHSGEGAWKLGRFHQGLACEKCHTAQARKAGMSRDCASCHGPWDKGTFDHGKTGLDLDETHREHACSDCHTDKTYATQRCTGCHEARFSYPTYLPGTRAEKK